MQHTSMRSQLGSRAPGARMAAKVAPKASRRTRVTVRAEKVCVPACSLLRDAGVIGPFRAG
jgi:hypothetical protein